VHRQSGRKSIALGLVFEVEMDTTSAGTDADVIG
jgi:hypothetical protein